MTTPVKEPTAFDVHQPIRSGADLMQWRRTLGISRPVYAALSDCSERTLATQEAQRHLELDKLRNLNETHRLLMGLCEIMEPANVAPWLNEPNDWFDGQTPLKVIHSGKIDQVWDMIYHTREGGFS